MKKIGIVGHFTGANSFGITKAYMSFFSQLGEVILLSPWEKEVRDLDLLVLPGGPDVDVFRYLEEEDDIHLFVGQPCMIRERFDKMLLPKYVAKKTPIFGICRGHQTLAVHFGGKLIQDMWHETNGDDRTKEVHRIVVEPRVSTLIQGTDLPLRFDVNSLHHQVVSSTGLPDIAKVLARYSNKTAKKDFRETIEALTYFPEYPAHTVQWHPEEIADSFSVRLIRHLLSLKKDESLQA